MKRRNFLQLGIAAGIGILTEKITTPFLDEVESAIERTTGLPTGNASIQIKKKAACANRDDIDDCVQHFTYSTDEKVMIIGIAPIIEELYFRVLLSVLVSLHDKREKPLNDVVYGTGGIGLNRQEVAIGATSSLVFAAVHNITENGIDTKTIPAASIFLGMAYWYLQRKLGFLANYTAHLSLNINATKLLFSSRVAT